MRLCKSFIDRIIALFGVTIIGSQSNEDGDVNGKKTNSFRMSKQQHAFFFVHFIARLRRENALCHVLSRGREQKTTTFFLIS